MTVQNTGSPGVKASVDGSRLTLTADRDTRGRGGERSGSWSATSSDSDPPSSRTAEGRIEFKVIGTPSPPGEPRPYPLSDEVGTIKMGWAPPDDDGGAPILYYMVREERTGAKQRCDTNECVFRKLKTGGNYSFRVQAINRVGASDWSNVSRSARADTQPGRVQDIRMVGRDDGQITIAWDKPSDQHLADPRLHDHLARAEAPSVVPAAPRPSPRHGPRQQPAVHFTVKAQNKVGYSLPRTSEPMQPLGTPPAPAAPAVTDLESGANQTSIRIAWQAVLPEGPGPTVYTVSYTNGVSVRDGPGCQRLASLTCTHAGVPYDGLTYTYTVVAAQPARRPAGKRSQPSPGTPSRRSAVRPPGAPSRSSPTGDEPGGRSVQYTVPDSRGTDSKVDILVGGAGRTGRSGSRPAPITTRSSDAQQRAALRRSQLRVCNEDAAGRVHAQRRAERPELRPPRASTLDESIRPVVNGKTITWTITGTSNGDPAVVGGAASTAAPERGVPPRRAGRFSFTPQTFTAAGLRRRTSASAVRLYDDAPGRPRRGPVRPHGRVRVPAAADDRHLAGAPRARRRRRPADVPACDARLRGTVHGRQLCASRS